MCRPPRVPANLEERTARRSERATFFRLCLLDNIRHFLCWNGGTIKKRQGGSHFTWPSRYSRAGSVGGVSIQERMAWIRSSNK